MIGSVDLVGIGTFCIGVASVGTLGWTILQQKTINRHSKEIARNRNREV